MARVVRSCSPDTRRTRRKEWKEMVFWPAVDHCPEFTVLDRLTLPLGRRNE